MKYIQNCDCKKDRYGRTPIAFVSGSDATPQKIYERIWMSGHGGNGYKFAVVIDASHDEYEMPAKETEVYYLDDILEEVCEYAGIERVKEWLRGKQND